MDDETIDEISRYAGDAVVARAAGDGEAAVAAVAYLADLGDWALYAACCSWAGLAASAVPGVGLGYAELEILDLDGNPVTPEALPAELAAELWASRYITAAANRDKEQMLALFYAMQADQDRLAEGMVLLLDQAALVLRDSRRQPDDPN